MSYIAAATPCALKIVSLEISGNSYAFSFVRPGIN